MNLSIEHETVYRFTEPADHSIQYLRLTPRPGPCQIVSSWSLESPGDVFPWTDGFDNLAHVSIQDRPHDEVAVVARGQVETKDTHGVLPADDGLSPLIFLRETPYTCIEGDIQGLAEPLRSKSDNDGPLPALHGLMDAVGEALTYEPGHTDVKSNAAQALKHGRGVCQDHAHLFIACCRVLGVPARYVSGYLLAGQDNDSHLASHAWAEAFVDGLGWVSFDPANNQSATDAYVRLAIGFDYADAGPMRGLRRGGGHEKLNVRVQVGQRQE
jgi:transglutaminase-like putative cysteine protease